MTLQDILRLHGLSSRAVFPVKAMTWPTSSIQQYCIRVGAALPMLDLCADNQRVSMHSYNGNNAGTIARYACSGGIPAATGEG